MLMKTAARFLLTDLFDIYEEGKVLIFLILHSSFTKPSFITFYHLYGGLKGGRNKT